MSIAKTLATSEPVTEVECTLSASDTYIETLTIKRIPAQPLLTELVIKTQLLTAKNPLAKQVKARSCIKRERLLELRDAINGFLRASGSSGEPVSR
ncbi:MAG: hypothetical protein EB069_10810 [Actinobacteria bacterium]|nr:hypothetical protein [Actinomycetota bacterium]